MVPLACSALPSSRKEESCIFPRSTRALAACYFDVSVDLRSIRRCRHPYLTEPLGQRVSRRCRAAPHRSAGSRPTHQLQALTLHGHIEDQESVADARRGCAWRDHPPFELISTL